MEVIKFATRKIIRMTYLVYAMVIACSIALASENPEQRPTLISGRITNEQGEPLAGASIQVVELNRGVSADNDGRFSVTVPPGTYAVSASYVAYGTQAKQGITVAEGSVTTVDFVLVQEGAALDEVVVVGYGTQSKAKVSSAIASLKMDELDKGAEVDAIKMMQGRVSGVNIQNSSGIPGSNPIIRVRGIGSISGASAPLIVIDGVPNESMIAINPADIESIEVLKDAAATAIYGSRANSGVVVVTTKSGKSGRTRLSLTQYTTVGEVANDIKMANVEQYIRVNQTAIDNYNNQMGTNLNYYIPDMIEETDWMKVISRSNPRTTSGNINVSGGTEKTTFFTSFGYFDQQGYLKRSGYKQYNGRVNLNHKPNDMINFFINLSGTFSKTQLLDEESTSLKPLRSAREEQPWYGPYFGDGTYTVNGAPILRHNPLMQIQERDWIQDEYKGIGVIGLEFTPIKGLSYAPTLKVYGEIFEDNMTLTADMVARANSAGWGAVAKTRGLRARYVFDNMLNYKSNWKKINYELLAGHSFEHYNYDGLGAFSDNYANGAFPSSSFGLVNAGTAIYPRGISYTTYAIESYIGRASLDYDGKYLINATIRSDGSSRFSKDRRYGTFPSLSVGWNVDQEAFWQSTLVSKLKLRSSWGITGSMSGIGDFSALALVGSGVVYNGQSGLQVSQDEQNLTWEKANQFNIGFDGELFGGRIAVTADYFNQKTTDLLYNRPIHATSGYTSIAANLGTLQNRGVEFSLNTNILQKKDWTWDVNANASFIQNKLLSLYDGEEMYILPAEGSGLLGGQMHALINGKSIGSFYMLKQLGIYQYDDEVPEKLYAKGVRAGDIIFDDVNNDGDITADDRQYVGSAVPNFFGGFTSNLKWKNWGLDVFAQFALGGKVLASWRGANSTEGIDHLGNALSTSIRVADGTITEQFYNSSEHAATTFWHGPGTSNTTPRPVRSGVFSGYSVGYNMQTSTRFLEDASYLKLKTITLSYMLPNHIARTVKLDRVRIYASVDNFLTFTKYSGYDPEQSFSASAGSAHYGVDFGLQPVLRSFMLGINIDL